MVASRRVAHLRAEDDRGRAGCPSGWRSTSCAPAAAAGAGSATLACSSGRTSRVDFARSFSRSRWSVSRFASAGVVSTSCALTIAWLETPLRRASGLVAPRFNGARGFFICPRIQIGRLGSEAMAAEAEVMSERALPSVPAPAAPLRRFCTRSHALVEYIKCETVTHQRSRSPQVEDLRMAPTTWFLALLLPLGGALRLGSPPAVTRRELGGLAASSLVPFSRPRPAAPRRRRSRALPRRCAGSA